MTAFTPEDEEEPMSYRAFLGRQARQVRGFGARGRLGDIGRWCCGLEWVWRRISVFGGSSGDLLRVLVFWPGESAKSLIISGLRGFLAEVWRFDPRKGGKWL